MVLTDTPMPGITAAAWAFTRPASCWRSRRWNGRTSMADISRPPRTGESNPREQQARYRCGTQTNLTPGPPRPRPGSGAENEPLAPDGDGGDGAAHPDEEPDEHRNERDSAQAFGVPAAANAGAFENAADAGQQQE